MSPGGGGIDYCQQIAYLLDFEGDYPHQDVEAAFTKVLIITELAQPNRFFPHTQFICHFPLAVVRLSGQHKLMGNENLTSNFVNSFKTEGNNMTITSSDARAAVYDFLSFVRHHEPDTRKPFLEDLATGLELDVATWFLEYERQDGYPYLSGLTSQSFATALKEWVGGRGYDELEQFLEIGEVDERMETESETMPLDAVAANIVELYYRAREMAEVLCSLLTDDAETALEELVSRGIVTDEDMRAFNASLTQLFTARDDIESHTSFLLDEVTSFQEARKAA